MGNFTSAVKLPTSIQKVPTSNLDQHTDYPDISRKFLHFVYLEMGQNRLLTILRPLTLNNQYIPATNTLLHEP
jgi:hypothetical protein